MCTQQAHIHRPASMDMKRSLPHIQLPHDTLLYTSRHVQVSQAGQCVPTPHPLYILIHQHPQVLTWAALHPSCPNFRLLLSAAACCC